MLVLTGALALLVRRLWRTGSFLLRADAVGLVCGWATLVSGLFWILTQSE